MPTRKKLPLTSNIYLAVILLICFISAISLVRLRSTRYMAIISGKGMSLQDIQFIVDKELPLGSSRNQIKKWFKGKNISYSYLDAQRGQLNHDSDTAQSGIPLKKLSGVLRANIIGSSGSIYKCRSHIVFFLDEKGNSIKRGVYGGCTNPIDRIEF